MDFFCPFLLLAASVFWILAFRQTKSDTRSPAGHALPKAAELGWRFAHWQILLLPMLLLVHGCGGRGDRKTSSTQSELAASAQALTTGATVTFDPNQYQGKIRVGTLGAIGVCDDSPSVCSYTGPRTFDLVPGITGLTAYRALVPPISARSEGIGALTISDQGVVTLDGLGQQFFSLAQTGNGAATVTLKNVVPITVNATGYYSPRDIILGPRRIWQFGSGSSATFNVLTGASYEVQDECGSCGPDDFCPSVFMNPGGTLSVDSPYSPALSASGSTVTLTGLQSVAFNMSGYSENFNWVPEILVGCAALPNPTFNLLRGLSYPFTYGAGVDPATGQGRSGGKEIQVGLDGKLTLGPVLAKSFVVVNDSTIAPILAHVRVARGGFVGALCLNYPGSQSTPLTCAQPAADLELTLIAERLYAVGAAATPNVLVHADGTCLVSSIDVSGSTLQVRCGLAAPGPVPTAPPLSPTGLTGVQSGPGRVDLAWTDVAGEAGFRVERSTTGSNFVPVQDVEANTTAFSDGTAVTGATNSYRVIAFNSVGSSPPSNVVSIAVGSSGPCGGTGNPCPDPAFTQFNHNATRIDYRNEPLAVAGAGLETTFPKSGTFDASNGELPIRPPTTSCVGSRVDNLRWSFTQDNVDFTTGPANSDLAAACGASASVSGQLPSLQLRRYHRPRLVSQVSSFGPGVFSNFDAKVSFYRQGLDGHPDAIFFDPETDAPALTLYERSAADGDNVDDGIFRDSDTRTYRQLALYSTSTPGSSGRVGDISQAILAVLERHDGGAIWFEPIVTNSGNPDQVDARPIAYVDRNGNRFNVAYQFARNATDDQLSFDRTQLWKIAKITDVVHANEMSFTYEARAATGRWLVKTVTTGVADGTSRLYTYTYSDGGGAADTLVQVQYPDGDKSLFSKVFDPVTQLWGLDFDDIGLGGGRLRKTVWVTGAVFQTSDGQVHGQTPGLVRSVINGSQEEVLRLQENPNDPSVTYVVEGNRRLTRITTDAQGTPKEVARGRAVTADLTAATYDVLESYVANAQGMITQAKDAAGKARSVVRDPLTRGTTAMTARDGTTASWTLNARGQPTHQVDRAGRLTDLTYDGRGNVQTVVEAKGSAIQATTSYTYDSTTGQMLTRQDALGRVTNYSYAGNRGYLASVTEPPDVPAGARAVTTFTNGAFGLITAKVDGSGHRTTFQYDARNRIVTTTYPDGTTETVTYGTRSLGALVVSKTDRLGGTETYEYDGARRLKRLVHAANRPEKKEELFEYVPGTELVSAATIDGVRTEYTYDERNRESSKRQFVTNTKSLVTMKTYDATDRLVVETDPYGRRTFQVYDATGRVARVVAELVPSGVPAGAGLASLARVTTPNPPYLIRDTNWDGMGRVLSRVNERGYTTAYVVDARGRVTDAVEASGTTNSRTTKFEYDLVGNLIKTTHPRTFRESVSVLSVSTFTGRDFLASRTSASGTAEAATTKYTYGATGKIATVTDPRNGLTTTTYDANDRAASVKDQDGFTSTFTYDAKGNQLTATSPIGQVWTKTFDGIGRITSERNPAGETATFQYDSDLTDGLGLDALYAAQISPLGFGPVSRGFAVLTTNPAGEKSLRVNDGLGRPVLLVDGNGNATKTGYDTTTVGLVETSLTTPLGNIVRSRVDGAGRQRSVIDPGSNTTNKSYDPAGNLLSTRDPNGVGDDRVYNEIDQLTSRTDTQGDKVTYVSDAAGNVTSTTDGAGSKTICVFDTLDRVSSCTNRIGATSKWAYDKAGNVISETDSQGGVTTTTYNARGLKTSRTFPDSSSTTDKQTFTYDAARNLASKTLQNGNVISYSYEAAGRLTKRTYPDAKNDTFTYDLASRIKTATSARYGSDVTWTYDSAGRPTKESLTFQSKSYDVSSIYDADGNVTKLKYPDGTEVNRTFTAREQLATLSLGTQAIASYSYDPGRRLTTTTLGNGLVESRTYRPDNTALTSSTPGVGDFSYTYDKDKRKLTEGGTAVTGGTQNFTYDGEGRVTKWTQGSSTTQTWVLSSEGDWTSTTLGSTTEARTHNAAHELTKVGSAALAFDARGDMTTDDKAQKLAYDLESRLQTFTKTSGSTTTTVTYFYDAVGRKVAKSVATSGSSITPTTVFINAGRSTIAEYLNGAPSLTYVLGRRVDDYVALVTSGKIYWFTRNQLGTVEAATDNLKAIKEKYRYTAYGDRTILSPSGSTLTTSALNNQIGFTGRYQDKDTGLLDFRYRYYHPRLGRFVSRDDRYRDGMNLYGAYFVPNATDPTGHSSATAFGTRGPGGRQAIGTNPEPRLSALLSGACSRPQVLYREAPGRYETAPNSVSTATRSYHRPSDAQEGEHTEGGGSDGAGGGNGQAGMAVAGAAILVGEGFGELATGAEIAALVEVLGFLGVAVIPATFIAIAVTNGSVDGEPSVAGQGAEGNGSEPTGAGGATETGSEPTVVPPPYPGDDPTVPPGEGWEKRGRNWYNPETGESLHPDLDHGPPHGPHYDWKDPEGRWWRLYPDGRVIPK
jgi:RHS repeat-associated protein